MPKWTDYTIKTEPADNDEVMVLDTAGKANKRLGLSALSDWIIGKIANKVFENLQTENKTILGAINELNGNLVSRKVENITQLPDGNKAKLISIGSIGIDVGSTGEKIPSWSFGIFLPSSGSGDACLFCFNITQITVAYKSNNIWVSCKKITLSN